MEYILPIVLVVVSNILYQVCAKSVPQAMNPLASLTITYIIGAIVSGVLYFFLNKDADLLKDYAQTNWAPLVLGFVIVGLEVGYIYAYKAGWQISTASTVQGSFLAIGVLVLGYFMYNEAITLNKIIGVVACLIGIFFINK